MKVGGGNNRGRGGMSSAGGGYAVGDGQMEEVG